MKVSYVEGLASYGGPESCVHIREGVGEALTGVRAGRVLSREIHALSRKRQVLRDADVVEEGGRQHRLRCHREAQPDPARSETPSMCGNTLRGNREIPRLPAEERTAGRIGKPKGVRR